MTETHQQREPERCTQKRAFFLTPSLSTELDRRVGASTPEATTPSRVVRTALREYFRRHPEK